MEGELIFVPLNDILIDASSQNLHTRFQLCVPKPLYLQINTFITHNQLGKGYVVKHNLITEAYLITVMETTTCFGLYWPSSGCLGNLRASYMRARARGVEISTYAQLDKPN